MKSKLVQVAVGMTVLCVAAAGCGQVEVTFTVKMTFGDTTQQSDGIYLDVEFMGSGSNQDGGEVQGYRLVVTSPDGQMIHFATASLNQFVGMESSVSYAFEIATVSEYALAGSPDSATVKLDVWGEAIGGGAFSESKSAAVSLTP